MSAIRWFTIDLMLAGRISSMPALVNFKLRITAMISSGVVGNEKNEWGKRLMLMISEGEFELSGKKKLLKASAKSE